ncbi:unnamed protein product [Amoebophrya sp. A25]|nr:unnamed protein product [Amoebophrya sp. A25]|eukprot:GSA25T00000282001.1
MAWTATSTLERLPLLQRLICSNEKELQLYDAVAPGGSKTHRKGVPSTGPEKGNYSTKKNRKANLKWRRLPAPDVAGVPSRAGQDSNGNVAEEASSSLSIFLNGDHNTPGVLRGNEAAPHQIGLNDTIETTSPSGKSDILERLQLVQAKGTALGTSQPLQAHRILKGLVPVRETVIPTQSLLDDYSTKAARASLATLVAAPEADPPILLQTRNDVVWSKDRWRDFLSLSRRFEEGDHFLRNGETGTMIAEQGRGPDASRFISGTRTRSVNGVLDRSANNRSSTLENYLSSPSRRASGRRSTRQDASRRSALSAIVPGRASVLARASANCGIFSALEDEGLPNLLEEIDQNDGLELGTDRGGGSLGNNKRDDASPRMTSRSLHQAYLGGQHLLPQRPDAIRSGKATYRNVSFARSPAKQVSWLCFPSGDVDMTNEFAYSYAVEKVSVFKNSSHDQETSPASPSRPPLPLKSHDMKMLVDDPHSSSRGFYNSDLIPEGEDKSKSLPAIVTNNDSQILTSSTQLAANANPTSSIIPPASLVSPAISSSVGSHLRPGEYQGKPMKKVKSAVRFGSVEQQNYDTSRVQEAQSGAKKGSVVERIGVTRSHDTNGEEWESEAKRTSFSALLRPSVYSTTSKILCVNGRTSLALGLNDNVGLLLGAVVGAEGQATKPWIEQQNDEALVKKPEFSEFTKEPDYCYRKDSTTGTGALVMSGKPEEAVEQGFGQEQSSAWETFNSNASDVGSLNLCLENKQRYVASLDSRINVTPTESITGCNADSSVPFPAIERASAGGSSSSKSARLARFTGGGTASADFSIYKVRRSDTTHGGAGFQEQDEEPDSNGTPLQPKRSTPSSFPPQAPSHQMKEKNDFVSDEYASKGLDHELQTVGKRRLSNSSTLLGFTAPQGEGEPPSISTTGGAVADSAVEGRAGSLEGKFSQGNMGVGVSFGPAVASDMKDMKADNVPRLASGGGVSAGSGTTGTGKVDAEAESPSTSPRKSGRFSRRLSQVMQPPPVFQDDSTTEKHHSEESAAAAFFIRSRPLEDIAEIPTDQPQPPMRNSVTNAIGEGGFSPQVVADKMVSRATFRRGSRFFARAATADIGSLSLFRRSTSGRRMSAIRGAPVAAGSPVGVRRRSSIEDLHKESKPSLLESASVNRRQQRRTWKEREKTLFEEALKKHVKTVKNSVSMVKNYKKQGGLFGGINAAGVAAAGSGGGSSGPLGSAMLEGPFLPAGIGLNASDGGMASMPLGIQFARNSSTNVMRRGSVLGASAVPLSSSRRGSVSVGAFPVIGSPVRSSQGMLQRSATFASASGIMQRAALELEYFRFEGNSLIPIPRASKQDHDPDSDRAGASVGLSSSHFGETGPRQRILEEENHAGGPKTENGAAAGGSATGSPNSLPRTGGNTSRDHDTDAFGGGELSTGRASLSRIEEEVGKVVSNMTFFENDELLHDEEAQRQDEAPPNEKQNPIQERQTSHMDNMDNKDKASRSFIHVAATPGPDRHHQQDAGEKTPLFTPMQEPGSGDKNFVGTESPGTSRGGSLANTTPTSSQLCSPITPLPSAAKDQEGNAVKERKSGEGSSGSITGPGVSRERRQSSIRRTSLVRDVTGRISLISAADLKRMTDMTPLGAVRRASATAAAQERDRERKSEKVDAEQQRRSSTGTASVRIDPAVIRREEASAETDQPEDRPSWPKRDHDKARRLSQDEAFTMRHKKEPPGSGSSRDPGVGADSSSSAPKTLIISGGGATSSEGSKVEQHESGKCNSFDSSESDDSDDGISRKQGKTNEKSWSTSEQHNDPSRSKHAAILSDREIALVFLRTLYASACSRAGLIDVGADSISSRILQHQANLSTSLAGKIQRSEEPLRQINVSAPPPRRSSLKSSTPAKSRSSGVAGETETKSGDALGATSSSTFSKPFLSDASDGSAVASFSSVRRMSVTLKEEPDILAVPQAEEDDAMLFDKRATGQDYNTSTIAGFSRQLKSALKTTSIGGSRVTTARLQETREESDSSDLDGSDGPRGGKKGNKAAPKSVSGHLRARLQRAVAERAAEELPSPDMRTDRKTTFFGRKSTERGVNPRDLGEMFHIRYFTFCMHFPESKLLIDKLAWHQEKLGKMITEEKIEFIFEEVQGALTGLLLGYVTDALEATQKKAQMETVRADRVMDFLGEVGLAPLVEEEEKILKDTLMKYLRSLHPKPNKRSDGIERRANWEALRKIQLSAMDVVNLVNQTLENFQAVYDDQKTKLIDDFALDTDVLPQFSIAAGVGHHIEDETHMMRDLLELYKGFCHMDTRKCGVLSGNQLNQLSRTIFRENRAAKQKYLHNVTQVNFCDFLRLVHKRRLDDLDAMKNELWKMTPRSSGHSYHDQYHGAPDDDLFRKPGRQTLDVTAIENYNREHSHTLSQPDVCKMLTRLEIFPKSVAEQLEIKEILELVFPTADDVLSFDEFQYLCKKIQNLLCFKYAESELRFVQKFFAPRQVSSFRKSFERLADPGSERVELSQVRNYLLVTYRLTVEVRELWRFLEEQVLMVNERGVPGHEMLNNVTARRMSMMSGTSAALATIGRGVAPQGDQNAGYAPQQEQENGSSGVSGAAGGGNTSGHVGDITANIIASLDAGLSAQVAGDESSFKTSAGPKSATFSGNIPDLHSSAMMNSVGASNVGIRDHDVGPSTAGYVGPSTTLNSDHRIGEKAQLSRHNQSIHDATTLSIPLGSATGVHFQTSGTDHNSERQGDPSSHHHEGNSASGINTTAAGAGTNNGISNISSGTSTSATGTAHHISSNSSTNPNATVTPSGAVGAGVHGNPNIASRDHTIAIRAQRRQTLRTERRMEVNPLAVEYGGSGKFISNGFGSGTGGQQQLSLAWLQEFGLSFDQFIVVLHWALSSKKPPKKQKAATSQATSGAANNTITNNIVIVNNDTSGLASAGGGGLQPGQRGGQAATGSPNMNSHGAASGGGLGSGNAAT